MTQKKTIPKKAPKRVERSSAKKRARTPSEEEEESNERSTKDRRTKSTQRVKRVEHSSLKKRARTPSKKKKKVTKKIKKRGEATKISWLIPHEKLRHRSERRRLKGRFSFRSVDFFTNILLGDLGLIVTREIRITK